MFNSEPVDTGHFVRFLLRLGRGAVDEAAYGLSQVNSGGIAWIQHQAQVLGDAGRLREVLHLEVARDRDVDPVLGGRDTIEQGRVVQRAVPGHLEPVEGSLVVRPLYVVGRDHVEREHILIVEVVVIVTTSSDSA